MEPKLIYTRQQFPEREHAFLKIVDAHDPATLSEGKWKKLYAICANACIKGERNVRVYRSDNGYDYDTTQHLAYPQISGEGTMSIGNIIKAHGGTENERGYKKPRVL